jgi:hypothetical protein
VQQRERFGPEFRDAKQARVDLPPPRIPDDEPKRRRGDDPFELTRYVARKLYAFNLSPKMVFKLLSEWNDTKGPHLDALSLALIVTDIGNELGIEHPALRRY